MLKPEKLAIIWIKYLV